MADTEADGLRIPRWIIAAGLGAALFAILIAAFVVQFPYATRILTRDLFVGGARERAAMFELAVTWDGVCSQSGDASEDWRGDPSLAAARLGSADAALCMADRYAGDDAAMRERRYFWLSYAYSVEANVKFAELRVLGDSLPPGRSDELDDDAMDAYRWVLEDRFLIGWRPGDLPPR